MDEEEIIKILEDMIKKLNGDMVIQHINFNKVKAIERNIRFIPKRKRKE
jgi:hypothetical protein